MGTGASVAVARYAGAYVFMSSSLACDGGKGDPRALIIMALALGERDESVEIYVPWRICVSGGCFFCFFFPRGIRLPAAFLLPFFLGWEIGLESQTLFLRFLLLCLTFSPLVLLDIGRVPRLS